MNKVISLLILGLSLNISSCNQAKDQETLRFATSAEYPPFEYNDHGAIKGFDIALAQLIAQKLGKKAVFDNIQFSTVLPAVNSGQDDVAISTITITTDRQKNFDFSEPYYFEAMALIYKNHSELKNPAALGGKKIAVQLGSVMELWLRQKYPTNELVAFDNNNQAIEALIADHVDAVLVDGVQGAVFSKKHPHLSYAIIGKADAGYGLALKKGSPLTVQINQALQQLQASGALKQLELQWIKGEL